MTYKDEAGLKRTAASLEGLLKESGRACELIIVDGGMSAGTAQRAEDLGDSVRLISEPDTGIYDAMNKGMAAASGDHLWFLNGGDECLVRWSQLSVMLGAHEGAVVLADFVLASSAREQTRATRSPRSLWHALPTSHQAIFYPRAQVSDRYDESFRVAADYDFTAKLYASGVPFVVEHVAVARFHLDGTSTQHGRLIGAEARRVQRDTLAVHPAVSFLSGLRHRAARKYRSMLSRGQ
ncbi:glycosyltransferase [Curtobacterium flaccumfaciens pv. flaccumfaciens]|uniref:glycosyltransferase n=1 Tax=Curtobacterium TaxID=2034 RepID=UPI002657D167|nr:glycosyltransferase [Curtobacterium flaccumfaciens]MCS5509738.1 glycosyltransferase [Curtobacterium flaccumfaciens pv. flaccumfaciens]MCX2787439.1 glycosyltransferase [Curtobacterium flaccumfaciens pv. flaccumfaciens]